MGTSLSSLSVYTNFGFCELSVVVFDCVKYFV
jgi:hypothetical protein